MLANLQDYTPSEIKFTLADAVKEQFPPILFEGADNPNEIMDLVNNNFIALYPDAELAVREMDKFEVDNVREEYCIITENELPKRNLELAQAIDEAKRIKKEAEDRLQAVHQTINDLAAQVKQGTKDYKLSSKYTIRIALNGFYLFYSWVDGAFQLVKGQRIPEWDKRSLWAQETKNRLAMKELFGYEFPEVEKPIDVNNDDNGSF